MRRTAARPMYPASLANASFDACGSPCFPVFQEDALRIAQLAIAMQELCERFVAPDGSSV